MPAVVISVEAARVENTIPFDYFTSEVALEEPLIGSTDQNIPIDNNCTESEPYSGMAGGCRDHDNIGDESDERDTIPTGSRWWRAATDLERFDLGTSHVAEYEWEDGHDADAGGEDEASPTDDGSTQNVADWGHSRFHPTNSDVEGYKGEDGDNADADEKEDASQPDDGSMQKVEHWGNSTRECKGWIVYFRPVNTIMAKQMQRQSIYPRRRLYCNNWHHLKDKHIWRECSIRYIAIAERYNVAFGRDKA